MKNPSFVVVVPSYNNEIFCEKNLYSILHQDYPFFRVIYIDDASTDLTFEKVSKMKDERVHLVKNEFNQGALANIYKAVHSIDDQDIVVLVDGDDWLKHSGVLSYLANVYKDDVYLTYGQYENYPFGSLGICRALDKPVRNSPWITSHLKTFYALLFKKIAKEDLCLDNRFFSVASDMAIMLPMIEMCGEKRVKFISEILYVYNVMNPLRDGNCRYEEQQKVGNLIKSKPPYKLLEKIFA